MAEQSPKVEESKPETAEPTKTNTKTEQGFHLPKFLSIDETFQTIKGKLGMEEKKAEENVKAEQSNPADEKTRASQPNAETSSEKKESGFNMNFMSAFDDTLHNIKGKLGLDEKKTGDSATTEQSNTAEQKPASNESQTTGSSEKKESGFNMNFMSAIDGTLHNIKGKLGFEEKKPGDSATSEQSNTAEQKSASSESQATGSSEKKESGFNMNFMSAFDDTLTNIKGKLGLDEKKSNDDAKGEQTEATAEKATGAQPETSAESDKKESKFHLPKLPSLDNTFQGLRETLGLEKREHSDAVSSKTGNVQAQSETPVEKEQKQGSPEPTSSTNNAAEAVSF